MLFFEGTPVEAWVLARVLAPVLVFAEPRSVWKPDERAVAAPLQRVAAASVLALREVVRHL